MLTTRWWLMATLSVLLLACNGRSHRRALCAPQTANRCWPPPQTVVDLTHQMHETMAYWPGGVPFKMTRLVDYAEGYRLHRFEMGENTGTHVDAPAHFIEGKRTVAQIPPDELVVPLVVIDVRDKTRNNPDYLLSANDVVDWEAAFGEIPVGSLVVANTGWHERFSDPERYINQDDQGVMHFPGFAPEAARLLVERDVAGIGIDTLSLDHGAAKTFATHKIMLDANKYQVENLANLDALPALGATVIIGVLPIVDGSQAQARVLALVPNKPDD